MSESQSKNGRDFQMEFPENRPGCSADQADSRRSVCQAAQGARRPADAPAAGKMTDALVDVLKDLPFKDRAVLEQLRTAFTALFKNLALDTTDVETTDHDE